MGICNSDMAERSIDLLSAMVVERGRLDRTDSRDHTGMVTALTRRALVTLPIVGAMSSILSGCSSVGQRTVRYRLTLVVETPEGERSGSSVVEVIYGDQSAFAGLAQGANWSVQTHGEATAIDLGQRGILFALLTRDPSRSSAPSEPGDVVYSIFKTYFPHGIVSGRAGADKLDAIMRDKPKMDLPFDKLPMLVRFRYINDPTTVERVDPNDVAASFGPGVKLVRATIEITHDAVTTGIEQYLRWWFVQAEPGFDPPAFRYPNNSPRGYGTISVTDFVQGIAWRQKK